MGAPKSAVTKATQRIREEAQALDERRQRQIANQVEIIDRLMDGATYDDVMQGLVEKLSTVEAENARLRAELKVD